ncbi:MAG: hypothetical protein ACI4TV_00185, partial [Paludibacteraceae bacterium]
FSRQPAPTKASDIWSFGAMCYELLESEVPFGEIGGGMQKGGAEIPALQAHVSDALKYTITKMLQKETWDRPTAATLIEWATNPQNIKIEYSLLEEGVSQTPPSKEPSSANPTNHAAQATQRFSTPPTETGQSTKRVVSEPPKRGIPKVKHPQKEVEKSGKNKWIRWLLVATVGLASYLLTDFIIVRNVTQKHDTVVAQFDMNVMKADIDNFESLESALNNLLSIRNYEHRSSYRGEDVYLSKRDILIDRTTGIYEEIDRKCKKAPKGTQTERRNYEKREKIIQIQEKIQNETRISY